jgi:predicted HNH restriction endonuclease
MLKLNRNAQITRMILIGVASHQHKTLRPGLISYKELWNELSDDPWGQFRTKDVVELISKVSSFELERGRPPLNELVVPVRHREPRQLWSEIRNHHRRMGLDVPYKSHADAQRACWEYWERNSNKPADNANISTMENSVAVKEAEEGYLQDRTTRFRKRNRDLVDERKRRDNYRCQACDFFCKVGATHIIDCHHKNPLGNSDDARVTSVDELVCLCPICHRIAHTSYPPLSLAKIRTLRNLPSRIAR